MRIAISLPPAVFQQLEDLKTLLGSNRSQIISEAIQTLARQHEEAQIMAQLNEVYSQHDSRLPDAWEWAQAEVIAKEDWGMSRQKRSR